MLSRTFFTMFWARLVTLTPHLVIRVLHDSKQFLRGELADVAGGGGGGGQGGGGHQGSLLWGEEGEERWCRSTGTLGAR